MEVTDSVTWRKSTYSSGGANNCVEVGSATDVLVRDTKDSGAGPVLSFTATAWSEFLTAL